MKIHANGTIEGSPAELVEYAKLTAKQPFKIMDQVLPKTTGVDAGKYPGSGIVYTKPVDPYGPRPMYDVSGSLML